MPHTQPSFTHHFRVLLGNARSQAAEMTLESGGAEGGPDNRHSGADQWLFVMSGRGEAIIDGERIPLHEATLLLIERVWRHQIRNIGDAPLRTVNFYIPSAYTAEGEELPAGKPE